MIAAVIESGLAGGGAADWAAACPDQASMVAPADAAQAPRYPLFIPAPWLEAKKKRPGGGVSLRSDVVVPV